MQKVALTSIGSFVDLENIKDGDILYTPTIEKTDSGDISCFLTELYVCKNKKLLETLPTELKARLKNSETELIVTPTKDDLKNAKLIAVNKGVCDYKHRKDCLFRFKQEFEQMSSAVAEAIENLED